MEYRVVAWAFFILLCILVGKEWRASIRRHHREVEEAQEYMNRLLEWEDRKEKAAERARPKVIGAQFVESSGINNNNVVPLRPRKEKQAESTS